MPTVNWSVIRDMKCKVCGNRESRLLLKKRIFGKEYSLVRCTACGFKSILPEPTKRELEAVYASGIDFDKMYYFNPAQVRKEAERRVRSILGYVQGGRLIDIGCGSGHFLDSAREAGFEVEGVEISEEAADIAKKEFGIKVSVGDLLDLELGRADIITMFHVIEHLGRPNEYIKRCKDMLKKNGLFVGIVPNTESSRSKLFGQSFIFDPPFHFSYFNRETLRKMLEKGGFEVLEIRTRKGLFNSRNLLFASMIAVARALPLRDQATDFFFKKGSKNSEMLRHVENITKVLALPLLPVEYVLDRLNGPQLMFFARKR